MKLLRNPIVAVLLAAAALGVVGWNIAGPMMKRSRPAKSASVRPTPKGTETKAVKAGTAKPDKVMATKGSRPTPDASGDTSAPAPGLPMDLAEIRSKIREWIEAPRRDPFERKAAAALVAEGPKAEDVLFIKAIWRQTGSRYAVINNLILEEGDRVSGFTLESIEGDFVRVRGSNGLERVEFLLVPKRKPATGTSGAGRTSARVARAP